MVTDVIADAVLFVKAAPIVGVSVPLAVVLESMSKFCAYGASIAARLMEPVPLPSAKRRTHNAAAMPHTAASDNFLRIIRMPSIFLGRESVGRRSAEILPQACNAVVSAFRRTMPSGDPAFSG